MTNSTLSSDVSNKDYCVFGLATCFIRQDGEISQVKIIEPIPSAALEAILHGIPTSYEFACAKTVGDVFKNHLPYIPSEFPKNTQFCEAFEERVFSATRTYKRRPEATKHINLGEINNKINYSLTKKRVLNSENIVSTEDNVKQHSHTHKVL